MSVKDAPQVRERLAALESALAECRHELTTHRGLYAIDHDPRASPDMIRHVWQIDCAALLDRIDAVLPSGEGHS